VENGRGVPRRKLLVAIVRFLKRLFSLLFSKNKRHHLFIENHVNDYYGENSTVFFYDDEGEVFEITLVCTCQEPVSIIDLDGDYEPELPHFECLHCDRVCTLKGCPSCMVYNSMIDARMLMEEGPKE